MKLAELPPRREVVTHLIYAVRREGDSISKGVEVRWYPNSDYWIRLPRQAILRPITVQEIDRYVRGFDDWEGVYA